MKLGISSYTYTWAIGVAGSMPEKSLTAIGLIDKASEAGLGLVQIADNLPLENLPPDELLNLKNYASLKGVSVEMGARGMTPAHTMKCLETAASLGSPILRMVIDLPGFEPDLQTIVSIVRELVPEFRARNIRLAIENHDRLKAREFEKIINSVGREMVGICLDSVNSMGAGEGFETVSKILAPYTFNLHIKDFSIRRVSHKMGLIIEGCPAGKGMLDIPGLIKSINLFGRCNSAILELWTPPAESIQETIQKEKSWAEESINYLKQLKWKD
ncbi:MAG: sugar phosphate isomerase/epimerase family protein [Bacteroidota bacterium]